MSSSRRTISVLLVEDNEIEAMMVLRACKSTKLADQITVVKDGTKALACLRRQNPYQQAPRTDLVLLDLNLPGIDGHDVLSEIKADRRLCRIPVVILTSSSLEQDILTSYQAGAAAFVTKPVGIDGFKTVMHTIVDFWADVVAFPNEPLN